MLSHSLGFLATQLATTLYDDFIEVVTEYNVTVRQCGVLFIAMHAQLPQTKLSKMMRVDKNIVVSMIDNLEEKGMVKRVKNQKIVRKTLFVLHQMVKRLPKNCMKKCKNDRGKSWVFCLMKTLPNFTIFLKIFIKIS
ncbi:MAG: MarR family transcriptional regulator [Helicobacter sp.]|uniref:MarR family winged helix-turn-helix transcriptional regulator n=1 Tax=Helicobacter sp. TaxID=218 RepID=UPI0037535315|nr:MarR family transcriptional regulator [Helicobacter sp.]